MALTVSGPPHMSYIDWSNPDHQRIVAASLVNGVYVRERDRQAQRHGNEALAHMWCRSFHFKFKSELVDRADDSIFGVIYEIEPPTKEDAPKSVIAFRGVLMKKKSWRRDVELSIYASGNCLHHKSRCQDALNYARELVARAGQENVWMVGHSLGAAIASYVGKNLADGGSNVTTFLFNPPFITAPIGRIKDKATTELLFNLHDEINAIIAQDSQLSKKPVNKSRTWVPNVYVNSGDDICSAYVGYFEHREKMEKKGLGHLWRLATHISLRDSILRFFSVDTYPFHLLLSAHLRVNGAKGSAHAVTQWLHPHQRLREKEFHYK